MLTHDRFNRFCSQQKRIQERLDVNLEVFQFAEVCWRFFADDEFVYEMTYSFRYMLLTNLLCKLFSV
jgi:hypothetical protein